MVAPPWRARAASDDRRDVVGGVVAGVQEVGQDEDPLGTVADRGIDRVGDRRFGELEEAGDDGRPEPAGDPGAEGGMGGVGIGEPLPWAARTTVAPASRQPDG